MAILVQFLLRLSFGLAAGMAITSSRQVSSGFFRNHLYVTLGLSALAAMASYTAAPTAFWYAIAAAAASYVGSVCWLYEKQAAGKVALLVILLCSLIGTVELTYVALESKHDQPFVDKYTPSGSDGFTRAEVADVLNRDRWIGLASRTLLLTSNVSSGLIMGIAMAAMLLGHWYLNSPSMELAPLRRLLVALGAAVVLQAFVTVLGLACELHFATELSTQSVLFILLRWSFGLIGVAALAWMAWQTLKIPNTQSATGILYVAIVGVFVGELTGLLLSAESRFPL